MATKAEVTEYLNSQWETGADSSLDAYWTDDVDGVMAGNRLSLIQNWMTPEIAAILQKLVGDTHLVARLAQNRSYNA